MKNNDSKWLDDFRDRLSGYEEPADMRLWENISRRVDGKRRKARMRIVAVRVLAAAACVALVCGIYVFLREDSLVLPVAKSLQSASVSEIANHAEDENVAEIAEADEVPIPVVSVTPSELREVMADKGIAKASVEVADSAVTVESSEKTSARPEKEQKRMSLYGKADELPKTDDEDYRSRSPRRSNRSGRWSTSLAVGNNFSSSSESQGGFMPLAASEDATFGPQYSATSPEKETYNDIVFKNIEKDTRTEVEYDFPVQVSAMARYKINDKFSVDAGLSFSKLGSSWKSGSEESYYRVKQKSYFIGVPVDVSFTFFDSRYVSCYVLAGGSVEKCVGGSVKTYLNNGGDGSSLSKDDIEEHPWQFSVKAGAGVQFNISRNYGIFVEPQIACYFDNAEKIELRKDDDPDFRLNVGMRFSY